VATEGLNVGANLTAEVDIDLEATVSIPVSEELQFPELHTVFHYEQTFADVALGSTGATQLGGAPYIAFENVQLDLGAFVSGFIKPILVDQNNIIDSDVAKKQNDDGSTTYYEKPNNGVLTLNIGPRGSDRGSGYDAQDERFEITSKTAQDSNGNEVEVTRVKFQGYTEEYVGVTKIVGDAGSGNDVIFAGAGEDKISGEDGDDWIEAGDGDDELISAGAGEDTFFIAATAASEDLTFTAVSTSAQVTRTRPATDTSPAQDITFTQSTSGIEAKLENRDVDGVTQDAVLVPTAMEHFVLDAGDGADAIVVNDLDGTSAASLIVDLGIASQTQLVEQPVYDDDGDPVYVWATDSDGSTRFAGGTMSGSLEEATVAGELATAIDDSDAYAATANGDTVSIVRNDGAAFSAEITRGYKVQATTEVEVSSGGNDGRADTMVIHAGPGADRFTLSTTDQHELSVEREGVMQFLLQNAQRISGDNLTILTYGGDDAVYAGSFPDADEEDEEFQGVSEDLLALTFVAGPGNDTLIGTRYDDVLDSGTGDDAVTGNAGVDVFYDAGGTDTLIETRDADLSLFDDRFVVGTIVGDDGGEFLKHQVSGQSIDELKELFLLDRPAIPGLEDTGDHYQAGAEVESLLDAADHPIFERAVIRGGPGNNILVVGDVSNTIYIGGSPLDVRDWSGHVTLNNQANNDGSLSEYYILNLKGNTGGQYNVQDTGGGVGYDELYVYGSPADDQFTLNAGDSEGDISAGVLTVGPLTVPNEGTVSLRSLEIAHNGRSGSFRLTSGGRSSGLIAHNASQNAIGNAMAALLDVPSGNVRVSGSGTAGDPWVVTLLDLVTTPEIVTHTASLTAGVVVETVTQGDSNTQEVQQIYHTGLEPADPSNPGGFDGGDFVLHYGGQQATLAYNASAEDVQNALGGMGANVSVTGQGRQTDPWIVTFDANGNRAAISGDGSGLAVDVDLDLHNPDRENVNYCQVERLTIRSLAGDDSFHCDDNSILTIIEMGQGDDTVLVGTVPEVADRNGKNVEYPGGIPVVDTTRMSNGNSAEMFVFGGRQDDEFEVNHNTAKLYLHGGDHDDTFVINTFLVLGDADDPDNLSTLFGGSGTDRYQYLQNAPVEINGGLGNDTLIINGTAIGDVFVVTDKSVAGAGRIVYYTGIERLEINGGGGADDIYVLSSNHDLEITVRGGTGDDTIQLGGDHPTMLFDPPEFNYQPPPYQVQPPPEIVWHDFYFNPGSTYTSMAWDYDDWWAWNDLGIYACNRIEGYFLNWYAKLDSSLPYFRVVDSQGNELSPQEMLDSLDYRYNWWQGWGLWWLWWDPWLNWSFHLDTPIHYQIGHEVWPDPITVSPDPIRYDPPAFAYKVDAKYTVADIKGRLTVDGGEQLESGDRLIVHNEDGTVTEGLLTDTTLDVMEGESVQRTDAQNRPLFDAGRILQRKGNTADSWNTEIEFEGDPEAGEGRYPLVETVYAATGEQRSFLNLQGLGLGSGTSLDTTPYHGVEIEGFEEMDIRLTEDGDTFTIEATHEGTTTLVLGAGDDVAYVEAISGALDILGGAGDDTVNVWDDADSAGQIDGRITFDGNAHRVDVTRTRLYSELDEEMRAVVDAAPDVYRHQQDASSGDPLYFQYVDYRDTTILTGQTGTVETDRPAAEAVPIVYRKPNDELWVNAARIDEATGRIVEIYWHERNAQGQKLYFDENGNLTTDDTHTEEWGDGDTVVEEEVPNTPYLTLVGDSRNELNVSLGSAGDSFTIQSTHGGQTTIDADGGNDIVAVRTIAGPTTISAGDGSDIVNVGHNGTVNQIVALLTVNGGSGDGDVLNIDDHADPTSNTGRLQFGSLTGLGMAQGIAYGAFDELNIDLGSGADTFAADQVDTVTNLDAGSGDDTITVGVVLPTENDLQAELTIDGRGGTDAVTVNLAGEGASLINVFDTGAGGSDTLTVHGTDTIPADDTEVGDQFLLRHSFVALLGDDDLVERINYNVNIEGGLFVFGHGGHDRFAVDDNASITVLDGGDGNDTFQVGQMFRSPRDAAAGVAPGDEFDTVETTRGYLSNGASYALTALGGEGDDTFQVYHNQAPLDLQGDAGDDTFIVRAFVRTDGQQQGATNISAGEGTDYIEYVLNAPVTIDGGDGLDTIVVIGTEFADAIVVTEDGIYGAGLAITYTNIERAEVDAMEGDDYIVVLSTPAGQHTVIIGGLGSDTISVAGAFDPSRITSAAEELPQATLKTDGIHGPLSVFGGEGPDRPIAEPVMLPGESNEGPDFPGAAVAVVEEHQIDTLNVCNTWSTSDDTGTLTDTRLWGLGMCGDTLIGDETILGGITYDDLETLNIGLGKGDDDFTIESTHGGITRVNAGMGDDTLNVRSLAGPTLIEGNVGNDTTNVGSLAPGGAGTVDGVAALLTAVGGQGDDTLNVDDTGDQDADVGQLTQTTLTGLDMTPVQPISQVYTLTVEATAGTFQLAVDGLGTTIGLSCDVPAEVVQAALEEILGQRNVAVLDAGSGRHLLMISDAEATSGDGSIAAPVRLTNALLSGLAPADVTYTADDSDGNFADGITLWAGSGDDTFVVESTHRHSGLRTVTTLNTGAGSDRATVQLDAAEDGFFVLNTQADDDVIDDADPSDIDRISSTAAAIGGADTITTGSGADIVGGGAEGDAMTVGDGRNIVFGDNALITAAGVDSPRWAGLPLVLGRAESVAPGAGDADTIATGSGNDILFGGAAGDTLTSGDGDNIILGDHGFIDYVADDGDPADIDRIATTDPTLGDGDTIAAGTGNDMILAGTADDTVAAGAGNDLVFGDHGQIVGNVNAAFLPLATPNKPFAFTSLDTQNSQLGGDDWLTGGAGDDILLGQQGADSLFGNDGDDDLIGGHNVPGGHDAGDFIGAGSGNDVVAGDNASVLRTGDTLSLRFRVLAGETIYDEDGNPLVTPDAQADPLGTATRHVILFDHSSSPAPDTWGSDQIAGGADHDVVFGQLGDDVIQGDAAILLDDEGAIDEAALAVLKQTQQSVSNRLTDGDDYIEGNGGADLIFGNLGQDDLIGGSSDLFGLDLPEQRPDSADVIHGMTGNDVLFGEGQDDDLYGGSGHDRLYGGSGEDGILGDDGKILTSRNGTNEPLNGIFEARQEAEISVPGPFTGAVIYIAGRLTKTVDLAAWEQGGNDVIYGGLGDDFLHGGAGDDAVSGAEALAEFYHAEDPSTLPLPYDSATGKFDAYDADGPAAKVEGFLLNFEAVDAAGAKIEDGKDRMFGDLGNDWLVGGTDNDRLFDYLGEFNSFIVPFGPFGVPTVNRMPSPHVTLFLLELGEASGSDQSLTEPDGELAMTGPGDDAWSDQHGRPRDPQPGNGHARRDTVGGPEDDSQETSADTEQDGAKGQSKK